MREVTASEFARNFGQYRDIAQREPIAVTSHGRATGYFVSANEFEELQRVRAFMRRNILVADMSEVEMKELLESRMSPEHDHLNALLDEE